MRSPIGLKVLAAFFLFGATMCVLTIVLLLWPGTALDAAWRVNPEARANFHRIGIFCSIGLMAMVGIACAFAAFGLFGRRYWGWRLAIGILVVNLLGDTFNVVARHDPRTLIGLPVAGAMIFYFWRSRATARAAGQRNG